MYNQQELRLLSEDEYVDILVSFLEFVPKEFVILRVISGADRDFLVAPSWVNDKQRLLIKINDEFARRASFQGIKAGNTVTNQ